MQARQSVREGRYLAFRLVGGDPDGDAGSVPRRSVSCPPGPTLTRRPVRFEWTPGSSRRVPIRCSSASPTPAGCHRHDRSRRLGDEREPCAGDHAARPCRTAGDDLTFTLTGSDPGRGYHADLQRDRICPKERRCPPMACSTGCSGPGQAGDHLVRFNISDGTTTTQKAVVLRAVSRAGRAHRHHSKQRRASPRCRVRACASTCSPAPYGDISQLTLTVDGQPVTLDAQGRAVSAGRCRWTDGARSDCNGCRRLRRHEDLRHQGANPADTAAPVVSFNDQTTNAIIDANTALRGVISDLNPRLLDARDLRPRPRKSSWSSDAARRRSAACSRGTQPGRVGRMASTSSAHGGRRCRPCRGHLIRSCIPDRVCPERRALSARRMPRCDGHARRAQLHA